jgi:hypothetical protein
MKRNESVKNNYPPCKMRNGDRIKINGDYQDLAITQGNSIQRFWPLLSKINI